MTDTPQTTPVSGYDVYKARGGTAAENYERYFVPAIGGPWSDELLAAADLRPGERVLDVACGTGIVARRAAARVGPGGSVAGLDLNPGMLAIARSVAPGGGGGGAAAIQWHQGPAESMPLPDGAFDVVLCQLGLQFVPDKPAALREMRRVLAPRGGGGGGGRVAISAGGPTPPALAILGKALARHIHPDLEAFVQRVFSLHDSAELQRLLREAGFGDIGVRTLPKPLRLPPPTEFLWQYILSTPMNEPVSRADAAARAALERDVVDGWQQFTRDNALAITPNMLLTTARRGE